MKILITGANGFIGKHVVEQLSLASHEVVTVGRSEGCNYRLDITSDADWDPILIGVDVVLHLAGLAHSKHFSQQDYQEVNVNGTLHLARKAQEAGVKRIVFVSSIGVNGTATLSKPFDVADKPRPHNAYSKSKLDAELGLNKISDEKVFEVVIVRPTLVYGPNAPGNFGSLTKLVRKVHVLPFGMANNKRDFISVHNLANLLVTCATHPNASGHVFLASDSEPVSIQEFTNKIAEGLGKKVLQLPVPISLMRLLGRVIGKADMIEQLYGDLQVDSSNAKEILEWTPPFTMKQSMVSLRKLT